MAEAIVSSVVESLGKLLIDQTIAFVTSYIEVHEQFKRLKKELESIQGFLHTADSYHNQDPGIRIWVSDVREIAYDVDDVIDAFLGKVAYKEEGESSFMRYARKPKKILNINKLRKKMETIFSKLEDISKRQKRYAGMTTERGISSSSTTNNMLLRRVYSHIKDDDIIGLEEHTHTLVSELLKKEHKLCVVSIYGMGGLGKTTLAKKVYYDINIKAHFDCYAWTSISQQLSVGEVLKEILRKVSTLTSKDMGEMNEVELVGKLNGILEGKQYLIVLDDMWNTKDWDILKPAFPNNEGSKIMLTTRNLEVARHADPWSCHFEPRFLKDEEAWVLLCRKALPPPYVMSSILPLSSDLEECGRMMVKKCGGLPLAIIVLGGILQVKRSLGEWKNMSKKIGTSADKDDQVLSILSLSYNELPYHLKPLFLYLGLFPEDSNIGVQNLVRMWMAERLIIEQEGETIEEVGRQCLDELIHRCMVQIGEKCLGEERAKTCRLHDKMQDLCIEIGKKENFFKVMSHQNNDPSSSSSSSSSILRRCAIHVEEKGMQYVFPKHLTPCLRTAIFIPKDLSTKYCPNIVYKDFKSVKVLEFHGKLKPEKELCGVVRKLSNLRYLSLRIDITIDRNKNYVEFGKFIGNFVWLETLDLRNFFIDESMCKVISNVMPQLRHFCCSKIQPSEINKMTKLQTLWFAQSGPWIKDLVKLTNLEKLCIEELDEKTIRLLINVIVGGGLDKLRSLLLQTGIEFHSDLLESLSEKPNLLKLRLLGKLKNGKLPYLFPSNLIKLTLGITNLSEDPMPTLEKLQHLLLLGLDQSYLGKEMVCSAKGFPKLQTLFIFGFNQLEEWTVEEGAMPCLTKCWIEDCKELKMVPQGFKFLTMLQGLKIIDMPTSFEQRVKEGGEDWPTIQHIPSIMIYSPY